MIFKPEFYLLLSFCVAYTRDIIGFQHACVGMQLEDATEQKLS